MCWKEGRSDKDRGRNKAKESGFSDHVDDNIHLA